MEYPANSTARIYYDIDGNEVTLRQLINQEPEWAVSRITVLEALLAETLPIVEKTEINVYPASLSMRIRANLSI